MIAPSPTTTPSIDLDERLPRISLATGRDHDYLLANNAPPAPFSTVGFPFQRLKGRLDGFLMIS